MLIGQSNDCLGMPAHSQCFTKKLVESCGSVSSDMGGEVAP